jgi:D-glycero-D-manno-heptose 1,7-bisphosphate phosphatase
MSRESAATLRPALFADRDGTIIVEKEYLSDPDQVELAPGAVEALRAFRDAGYALIVVTNQSGIARGLFSRSDYERVEARVAQLLSAEGLILDGVYYCPHHPECGDVCECRKPGTLLYRQAAADHGLDVTRSVYTGDRRSDVEPAAMLGGRGILLLSGYGREQAVGFEGEVAADLSEVAAKVLRLDTQDSRK